jgi:hypothetical protein
MNKTIFITLCTISTSALFAQIANDPLIYKQTGLKDANIFNAWYNEKGDTNLKISIFQLGKPTPHEDLLIDRNYTANQHHLYPHTRGGLIELPGILSATTNNNKGIAGINWFSKLHNYDVLSIKTIETELNRMSVYHSVDGLAIDKLDDAITHASNNTDIIYFPLAIVSKFSAGLIDPKKTGIVNLVIDIGTKDLYHGKGWTGVAQKHVLKVIEYLSDRETDYSKFVHSIKNSYSQGTILVCNPFKYASTLPIDIVSSPSSLNKSGHILNVGVYDSENDRVSDYNYINSNSTKDFPYYSTCNFVCD